MNLKKQKSTNKHIPKNFNYKAFRSQMKNLSVDLDNQYPDKSDLKEKEVPQRISIGTTQTGFATDQMTFEVASQNALKKDKFKSGMSVFSIVTLAEIINK